MTNKRLLILVKKFGTPLYVYDAQDIRARCRALQNAFANLSPHIHYSVKANSNLSILRLLYEQGLGFDIVSGGELARLQAANIPTQEVSFAGVGKTRAEIEAALRAGIAFFNVESAPELARIAEIAAALKIPARVLLRLNPNVDAHTHKFITTGRAANKFGIDFETAAHLSDAFAAHSWLKITGYHLHIGSQIQQIEPYLLAAEKTLAFIAARRAAGQKVDWLSLGGGFGVPYEGQEEFSLDALAQKLHPLLNGQNLKLILEPGRWLLARAGTLLMTVQYVKHSAGESTSRPHAERGNEKGGGKTFVIVDAGMNTFIRPALYGGWHKIWPLHSSRRSMVGGQQSAAQDAPELLKCDVVGPICESTDVLAKDRLLPPVQAGDILALSDAGAYGMVMASTYNSHPRPAEVLVDGDAYRLIRRRETYQDLVALEIDV